MCLRAADNIISYERKRERHCIRFASARVYVCACGGNIWTYREKRQQTSIRCAEQISDRHVICLLWCSIAHMMFEWLETHTRETLLKILFRFNDDGRCISCMMRVKRLKFVNAITYERTYFQRHSGFLMWFSHINCHIKLFWSRAPRSRCSTVLFTLIFHSFRRWRIFKKESNFSYTDSAHMSCGDIYKICILHVLRLTLKSYISTRNEIYSFFGVSNVDAQKSPPSDKRILKVVGFISI